MSDQMKYIVFEKPDGEQYSVVFPSFMVHVNVAVTTMKETKAKPIAAGFVIKDAFDAYVCFGKSVSLKLDSRPKLDDKLVNSETNVVLK